MSCFVELCRARPLLGTFVEISAGARREALVRMGMTRAFDVIAEVQRLMSFHEAASDVSRLNRAAFCRPVRVHSWSWHVLARAQEFAVASRGAFDITIAPLLSMWGYLPIHYEGDSAASFRDIILLPGGLVRFARPLSIDLGGIAKGFAVDCAVEALRAEGVEAGTVNAGGDLRAFGDEAQQIHLRDPASPGRAAGVVSLQNRALATSGIYFSRKIHRGAPVSPLIDGRTRAPFLSEVSVVVSAPNCLTADALTKIVAARGAECCSLLHACNAEVVILERGKNPRVFRR
jgi:FAD:protein FMN transferase